MTDDAHSLATLYALDALDPDEVRAFEAHLAACDACQAEVAEAREVAAALSATVATDPPAHLRDAVLAEVAALAPEPDAVRGRHAAPPADVADDAAQADPARDATAGSSTRQDRQLDAPKPATRRWVLALAAAVVAIALAGVAGWAVRERDQARDEAASAQDQAAELTRILAAPDLQTGTAAVSGGGTATVIRSARREAAVLVANELPTLPGGKVYEAWTITGGGDPVPAGTFSVSDGAVALRLPSAALEAGAVALSVEPAGGSPQPSDEPIAAIELPSG